MRTYDTGSHCNTQGDGQLIFESDRHLRRALWQLCSVSYNGEENNSNKRLTDDSSVRQPIDGVYQEFCCDSNDLGSSTISNDRCHNERI